MEKPASFDVEAAPKGSTAKSIGLAIAGWFVGYLISVISSILFFMVGRIPPHRPASTMVMWATAIYGIVFSVFASAVGASFCRRYALGIGAAIALTIGAAGMWSWYVTPDQAHWSQAIAILLMAPAAQFGSLSRRLTD
jgi:hypothetical protein